MRSNKKINVANLIGKALSRKGMGIELALLMLLVVFGCSALLVSSAMYGNEALMQKKQETLEQIKLDQIAQEIITVKDDADAVNIVKAKYPDYIIEITSYSLKIFDRSNNLLLTVEQSNGIITKWSYH